MVCAEDQKKIVLEKQKFVERQLNDLEEETSKLADRVTAALVNYEEHIRDHERLKLMSSKAWTKNLIKERICQVTGTKWMHPCNVLEWK